MSAECSAMAGPSGLMCTWQRVEDHQCGSSMGFGSVLPLSLIHKHSEEREGS